jgi:hypothetical protein
MKPNQGVPARLIAGSVVLALTLSSFASAQEYAASATITGQANGKSVEQLPDSPGAIQARPSDLTEIAMSQENGQVPQSETAPQEPKSSVDPTTDANSHQPNSSQDSEQATSQSQTTTSSTQGADPQPAAQPQQPSAQAPPSQTPRDPVGTAAAESIETTGVAASRPAGAAVAPAKQRRVRSILIKVGALVGIGAAVGTTMALSKGSPSKPPGAR